MLGYIVASIKKLGVLLWEQSTQLICSVRTLVYVIAYGLASPDWPRQPP